MDANISLFNTLYYVSMAVAAIGLALAVFFFFYFDIPTVRAMMTGKAKEKTVRRMEEQNARTGKLRVDYDYTGGTGKTRQSSKLGQSSGIDRAEKTEPILSEPPVYQPQQRLDTSVLSRNAPETSILQESQVETTMLNQADSCETADQTAILPPNRNLIRFDVTENTVVIHTDEIL